MIKLKTFAIITIILGIISLVWVLYDYLALTDIVYNFGQEQILLEKRRIITMGFIPIILFHFSFFMTMYFMFDYLRTSKAERLKLQEELDKQKTMPADSQTEQGL